MKQGNVNIWVKNIEWGGNRIMPSKECSMSFSLDELRKMWSVEIDPVDGNEILNSEMLDEIVRGRLEKENDCEVLGFKREFV